MRIGLTNYINPYPLTLGLDFPADYTYAVPTTLNRLLRDQELDLALISTAAFLDDGGIPLPFGIAGKEAIHSVNLYHRGDLSTIALTEQSASSISLLKVLCTHFWDVDPTFTPLNREELGEAFLLIGDEALQKRDIPGYETVDLCSAWFQETGLPFVFALFVHHPGINPAPFAHALEASLQWGEAHMPEVLDKAQEISALPRATLESYFSLFRYRLGQEEVEGIRRFGELRSACPVA